MISVSDSQLRIVAEAAELLPSGARGAFLRRVVAEVREGRSFKDSDIKRAVRLALLDQPMKLAPPSSTDQGGGKRHSDAPPVFPEALAAHPFAVFLRRVASFVRLRGFPRSFNPAQSIESRCEKSCSVLRQHFEAAQRHVLDGKGHIARQREIVACLEHLGEPLTLQKARDLLRNMEHTQLLHVTERDRLREFLGR
jgi:hypothetical protein